MPRKQAFLSGNFSEPFKAAYAALQSAQQSGADKVILALLKMSPTAGMRVKPIEPDKHYNEARINDGDRLIHCLHDGVLYFVDIVKHDDIDRYARTPRSRMSR